jgi:LAS superfamily LD-carboxypeptidase LdcB
MKLLYRIPKRFQLLLIGTASTLTIVSIGLFASALLPQGNLAAPNTASSIVVSPTMPLATNSSAKDKTAANAPNTAEQAAAAIAPLSPVPTVPKPGSAANQPTSPISSQALSTAPTTHGQAEPYDDLHAAKFNHLAYGEADLSRLVSVGLFVREDYQREEFLDADAAQAFINMAAAARADGVRLLPVSGFRTIKEQSELFAKQVEKLGSEAAAAKLSAPPGHSEHHTGYAIDIADASRPETDIKYDFEFTAAYIWLQANASTYGFELSFPNGNQQGVSFEPWHWRFIGMPDAQQTFYLGRSLSTSP